MVSRFFFPNEHTLRTSDYIHEEVSQIKIEKQQIRQKVACTERKKERNDKESLHAMPNIFPPDTSLYFNRKGPRGETKVWSSLSGTDLKK